MKDAGVDSHQHAETHTIYSLWALGLDTKGTAAAAAAAATATAATLTTIPSIAIGGAGI